METPQNYTTYFSPQFIQILKKEKKLIDPILTEILDRLQYLETQNTKFYFQNRKLTEQNKTLRDAFQLLNNPKES